MKIAIIGTGHVGLVTGACFAEKGHDVLCTDSDGEKIEGLRRGKMPFFEPGLEDLVRRHAAEGRLRFGGSTAEAVRHGEVIFLSVWTPPLLSGRADLSFVEKVCRELGENLRPGEHRLVVEKSTVPVRTGERVLKTLRRYACEGASFSVASNPEFLREGSAVEDTLGPDRIVFGVADAASEKTLRDLYADFPCPLVVTDVPSAELIKHASNAFLAMKISFINAVSIICELAGADVDQVADGMGLDARIQRAFLNAGIGYGGSCFPKDVAAFIDIARELGFEFRLLEEVERINRMMRQHFLGKIEKELWILRDKRIAALGLSFKPGTDDMRMAPSLTIVEELRKAGASVRAFDPVATDAARIAFAEHGVEEGEGFCFVGSAEEACRDAEAVCVFTEWPEIVGADWKALGDAVKTRLVFDGRNCLDHAALRAAGWTVRGMGKK
jgi:UDPglucose 6-dehydrogenase